MLFNSSGFLVFFPVVVLAYFVLPRRAKQPWLLLASYFFYGCWSVKYTVLLAFTTVVTYAAGRLMGRSDSVRAKRGWLTASLVVNLGILFFYKYFDFALLGVNRALGLLGAGPLMQPLSLVLPVGISFYTLQALGYTIDVYRGKLAPEKSLVTYALFVSFFPQLVAGPIERSENLLGQVREPKPFCFENARSGLMLMLWGFLMKLVIGDRAAVFVNAVYADPLACTGPTLALATFLFAVQIYCDFAGYSAIAIGAGRVLGIRLMQNFDAPYFATSIRDFWRRWHISLSTWLRDYLYIPLGGSRCSKARYYLNLMVTFLVSGLWHGAGLHFVAWGGLHGAYQVAGDLTSQPRARLRRALRIREGAAWYRLWQGLCTFCLCCVAWVFFRADSFTQAVAILGRVLGSLSGPLNPHPFRYGLSALQMAVLGGGIALLAAVDALRRRVSLGALWARQCLPVRWLAAWLLLFGVVLLGWYGTGLGASAFIYFQF